MLRQRVLCCCLLNLLFLAALFPANGQETYRFGGKDTIGDVHQSSEEFSMDVPIQTSYPDGKTRMFPFIPRLQIKYRQEVLAVNTKGNATRVRRMYALDQSSGLSTGGKMIPSSLQGKTVTIEIENDHVTVKSEGAAITQGDRESLKDALNNDSRTMFPDHLMTIGEEWTPDPKSLLRDFTHSQKITAHCKLVEFVAFEGHRCAHFHLNLEEALPLGEGSALMNLKLEGEGYEAMGIHRLLSLDISGPITVSGKTTRNGLTLEVGGSGTAHIKNTWEWLKVDGKPVVQNRPDAKPM